MIEYVNVYKRFDEPVLSGVDLRIETGETVALVGPSGTGKSVLLKTTLGLITPDRGDVRLDGRSVYRSEPATIARLRRKVGYVFQFGALFDSMTVFDNVSMGLPEPVLEAMDRRELVRRVANAIEHVNLQPRAVFPKLPSELSGGMRKRVGLARAIIGEPEILLYDEPVTGLDPVNGAVIHELIERLAEEMGITSVFITHDVYGALGISDRVALLHEGRIRFVGTPDEFRNSSDPLVRAFLHGESAPGESIEFAQAR